MGRLDKLKEIIDRKLGRVTFTEFDKASVYQKIEQRKAQRGRSFKIGLSATAAVCAAAMLVLLVLPAFNKANEARKETIVAETDSLDSVSAAEDYNEEKDKMESSSTVGGVKVTALSAAGRGLIANNSGFYIDTSESSIDANDVKENLEIEPAVSYTLTMESENLCLVSLNDELPESSIITLSLDSETGERSWAFQTESSMQIVSTTPAEGSNGMPFDTGIEIEFSRIVADSAQEYFAITPAVSGSFLYKGKTLIFVPDEDLEKDTIYTVMLSAGLEAGSGEKLAEDYSFSFRTPMNYEDGYKYFDYSDGFTQTFVPGDTIALQVGVSNNIRENDVKMTVFSLADEMEYLSYAAQAKEMLHSGLGAFRDISFDLSDKNVILDTKTTITKTENEYGGTDCVILPALSEGWYAVRLSITDGADTLALDKLIQVTPVSVYYQNLPGQSLFWVNSTVTGKALAGAEITFTADGESVKAVCDANGVACIDYDADTAQYALVAIRSGQGKYAEALDLAGNYEDSLSDAYYSFVYLDRSAYRPNDTISYWGSLQPRKQGTALPKELDVLVSGYGRNSHKIGTVSVSDSGIFTGSFTIENHISGYVNLSFACGDKNVASTSFNVSDYTKPSYILDLVLDKTFYRKGEMVNAGVDVSFFDGTPAAGISVDVEYEGDTRNLTADADGKADTAFKPSNDYIESWDGGYISVSAVLSGTEDVFVSDYAQAKYFPSDIMLTADAEKDSTAINIRANEIDFDAVGEHLNDYYSDPDLIRGDGVSVSGTVEIYKHYYEKFESGYYYDEIEKRRVDTYDYRYCEELFLSEVFVTDGNGRYKTPAYELPEIEDGWYTARICYTDADGFFMRTELGLTRQTNPYWGSGYYFDIEGDKNLLRLNESVKVRLSNYSGEEITKGSMMCSLVTDHILSETVGKAGEYTVTFTQDCIPNVRLLSAYFDGKHVHMVPDCWFRYDTSEKKLDIEIIPSAETYAPGEKAKAQIIIRDADGNPVKADFVLSVVDEAAFAVQDQNAAPLADYYRSIYTNRAVRYASFKDKNDMAVAEGGGEGGTEGLRENFKDTAAFIGASTGADGKASVEFELPENLTSWRLTVVAASESVRAGSEKTDISVSQDFFINVVVDDCYTAGDDIALSARVYGAKNGEEVEYEVYLDDKYVSSFFGKSGDYTFINLGALDAGSYELGIRAVCGKHEDGIITPVSVKASRHSFLRHDKGLLSDGICIDPDKFPATVTFFDSANSSYMKALFALMNGKMTRADRYIGYSAGYNGLKSYDDKLSLTAPDKMNWQDYSGGVTLMPYSSPDVRTTAMALAVGREYIDEQAALSFLYGIAADYNAPSLSVSQAYMGLAAAGEPVLADIYVLMDSFETDSEEYYYLSCALALLGDRAYAAECYDKMFTVSKKGVYCFVKGADADDTYEKTAHALFLASFLGKSETEAMSDYLIDKEQSSYLAAFELTAFVRNYHVRPADSSFTYTLGGKTEKVDFKDSRIVVLELTKSELEKADFTLVSGEVSYIAVYSAELDESQCNANGLISATLKPAMENCEVGERLDYVVTVNASAECADDRFIVDIVLPAGVRYTSYNHKWDANYSLVLNENNRLRFVVWRSENAGYKADSVSPAIRHNEKQQDFYISFVIHTRTILKGHFIGEVPVIQAPMSDLTAVGTRTAVTIK